MVTLNYRNCIIKSLKQVMRGERFLAFDLLKCNQYKFDTILFDAYCLLQCNQILSPIFQSHDPTQSVTWYDHTFVQAGQWIMIPHKPQLCALTELPSN